MADIPLDAVEVRTIRSFRERRDFPGGYAYISAIIAKHPDFDKSTAFWFEKARTINMNVRSDPADVYIRSVTACGLRWDGKMGGDRVANARMMQQTSDNIAVAVLDQVANDGAITSVNLFLNKDIVGALASGQTIGGWGGAFYYWNAPFNPPGGGATTVGTYILSHPDEREKFVACNAAASLDAVFLTEVPKPLLLAPSPAGIDSDTAARLALLGQGLATTGQAKAPGFIKSEIRSRAAGITFGATVARNPNHIGDYTYDGRTWSTPQPLNGVFPFFPSIPVKDPAVLRQLDARRQVRQQHQGYKAPPY